MGSRAFRPAAVLDEPHWAGIAKAYDRVRGHNWRYEAGVSADDSAERETVCRKVVEDASVARDVLQNYIPD